MFAKGLSRNLGDPAVSTYIEDELSEFMIRNKDTVPEHIDFTMNGDEVVLVPRPVEEPIAN